MRLPSVSGRFYPSDPDSLRDVIESCFLHRLGPGIPGHGTGSRSIRGAVAPHAGYMASGMNAAHTYAAIMEDGLPEAYVIIGPDHHGIVPTVSMCSEGYMTPFGECRVHEDICRRLSRSIPDRPDHHMYEHSVEVQVPFIQSIDPDPRIVPIIMGDQSFGSAKMLAEVISDSCEGHDVIVLASTDMSHYIPKSEATSLDGMVLDRVRSMDAEGMMGCVRGNRVSMCGPGPVSVAMMCSKGCSAEILVYTDSFDSLCTDEDSVVGYASAVFRKG